MRKIKAKKATNKEIEFFISQMSKLEVLDFIGIAKICGVKLLKDEDKEIKTEVEVKDDAATSNENGEEKKPEARDFYEILVDIVDYYKDSKKERRQTLMSILNDCVHENKKRGGKNGLESQNTTAGKTISS